VLILLPSEEGWAKAGINDKAPINDMNFTYFLNAARLTDFIVSMLIFLPTLILAGLTLIDIPMINMIFMYWMEISYFAQMGLFLIAPALMTKSFVWEKSMTPKRVGEQFGNFFFNLVFMGAHFFFMPDLQIWYSKAMMNCHYDSMLDASDK